ncbi:hypothetical protein [Rhizohabitans arisaemae]|uniref:hypothetical protein n=1 Tax=Rhizohabitans arisaemae TaxID=2720610 RepID=UPI0024B10F20|nr:hypothetical protein [Rhizohabitans arisaemae]
MLFSSGWRGSVLALFSGGLLVGGAVSGTALWALSGLTEPLPGPWRAWPPVLAAALGVLREAGVLRIALPQNARQIPQAVLQRDVRRGALRFGFELGTGVRTYVSSTAPYVLAAGLLFARPDLPAALLIGACFGAGRALTALLGSLRGPVDRLRAITVAITVVTLVSLTLLLLG